MYYTRWWLKKKKWWREFCIERRVGGSTHTVHSLDTIWDSWMDSSISPYTSYTGWMGGVSLSIWYIRCVCVCVCGIYIFFALNLCFYGFFLSNGILYLFCFLNLISRNGKRMAVTLIRTTWSHNAGLLGEYKCWVLLFRWWQRGGGGTFQLFEIILSCHRLFRRDFLFFLSIQIIERTKKMAF